VVVQGGRGGEEGVSGGGCRGVVARPGHHVVEGGVEKGCDPAERIGGVGLRKGREG